MGHSVGPMRLAYVSVLHRWEVPGSCNLLMYSSLRDLDLYLKENHSIKIIAYAVSVNHDRLERCTTLLQQRYST